MAKNNKANAIIRNRNQMKKNKQKFKKENKKIKQSHQLKDKNLIKNVNKNKIQKDSSTTKSSKSEIPVLKHSTKRTNLDIEKLSQLLNAKSSTSTKKHWKDMSLRERMWQKLKSARFRFLNQEMYTKSGDQAKKLFESDPEAFKNYHEGYKQQVAQWPINPLDIVIDTLKKSPKNLIVADFGCGDARLSQSVPQRVHSFDLVALNSRVTVCNMAKTPLKNETVDIAVYCLSLMGTDLGDYLFEANRVLKIGGTLKIVEVESRFEKVDEFVAAIERFGFEKTYQDFSHALFYFFDFKKLRNIKNKNKLPNVSLNPCLYKKR